MRRDRSNRSNLVLSLAAFGLLALTTAACSTPQLGAAAKQSITKRLANQQDGYQSCYDAALKRQRTLGGEVVLELTVTERGALKSLSVIKNETGDKSFADCVVDTTRDVKLPARLPGRVYLTYAVTFAPTKGS